MEYFKANYLDASAAVKLFVDEPQAEVIRQYFARPEVFYMTQVCFFETLGTLSAKYKKRNSIPPEQYFRSAFLFVTYVQEDKIRLEEVPLTSKLSWREILPRSTSWISQTRFNC